MWVFGVVVRVVGVRMMGEGAGGALKGGGAGWSCK